MNCFYVCFSSTKQRIPPKEEPIVSIYASIKTVNSTGFYYVSFKSTGENKRILLSSTDIVKRCTYHSQKIPFIIGNDKHTNVNYRINLGDDLLVIV